MNGNTFTTEIRDWIRKPISGDMDLTTVALTTVFVLTIAFLWTRVLRHVLKEYTANGTETLAFPWSRFGCGLLARNEISGSPSVTRGRDTSRLNGPG